MLTIKSIFATCLLLLATTLLQAQVGVGTSIPAASAKLEISSTTQGFLPPRMTTAERNAISSPATGLVIFNTTTNSLEIRNSSAWASLSTAGVNNDITQLNGLTNQKLITQIAGPINTSSYSAGDVVYDQSSAKYYFFKSELPQSSSSYSNFTAGFTIFDAGRVVIRMRPDRTNSIASITLNVWNFTGGVLSMYAALGANSTSCGFGNAVVAVDPATLMGSSSSTTGSGYVTFTFGTPISVTADTDYYLTFSSACVSGANIGVVNNTTSSNFAISYGTTTINQGIPAIRINYNTYGLTSVVL